MSFDRRESRDGESAAERLAELTSKPVEEFEYDGEVPDIEDLAWEEIDE